MYDMIPFSFTRNDTIRLARMIDEKACHICIQEENLVFRFGRQRAWSNRRLYALIDGVVSVASKDVMFELRKSFGWKCADFRRTTL